MLTQTATRVAATVLYATVAAVPAAMLTAPSAHAETPQAPVVTAHAGKVPAWTSSDKRLMRQANRDCRGITDDVTYEFCVIGDFHLSYGGPRVITADDYTYNAKGVIVLVQSNGKVA